jgi:GNAT superfamily N-acetyltransferase
MAGDIWHRWRFMTDGFDTPDFPGEPRQPKYYPELFIACGFNRVRTFSTKCITDIEAQLNRVKTARDLNHKRGYTFRNFDTSKWQEDIESLHELCQHSFASNWGVTPIAFEEFADIYNRWLTRIGPDHILLALDPKKNVVGLGLAVASPSDTLNIRTLAVLPGHYGYGLGRAIGAELYQRALDAGQTTVQHCLMGPDAPPQRWDGGKAQVTREYAMFERGIE